MKKIKSTKNFKEGDVIRVYKKGYGYSKLTVFDNCDHFLAAWATEDFFQKVNDGDFLESYFWRENEDSYSFSIEAIGRINRLKILFFEHTDDISSSSKKSCLMADVDLPILFFLFNTSEKPEVFSSEKIIYNHGKLLRLSDREALLKSEILLPENAYIYGHLNLNGESIEIVGKADLINEKDYVYNMEFRGIGEKERNMILDYVFSVYRET